MILQRNTIGIIILVVLVTRCDILCTGMIVSFSCDYYLQKDITMSTTTMTAKTVKWGRHL